MPIHNVFLSGKPTQAGGKEGFLPKIDYHTAQAMGVEMATLNQFSYADVFAGAGSYSLNRKLYGCTQLHSNDLGDLNFHILNALISNSSVKLDLSEALDPSNCDDFIEREMCPLVFPTSHGVVLDWVVSTARSKQCPHTRGLWMLLAMKYAQSIVGFATTLGPSNGPLARVIDGLDQLSGLNDKRLRDGTLEKGLQSPAKLLKTLVAKINQSVFSGTGPASAYNLCAFDFVKQTQVQIGYFDPPYPGTLDYERYHYHLDAVLKGSWPKKPTGKNPFTQSVDTFLDLLSQSHHIPVWVCSYGNKVVPADELGQLIQTVAPQREITVDAWNVVHMPHVSKSTTNQEVLVVAVNRAGL